MKRNKFEKLFEDLRESWNFTSGSSQIWSFGSNSNLQYFYQQVFFSYFIALIRKRRTVHVTK